MSRILIVDDKEMMRDSVGATLSRKGHTIVAASSGKVALGKISERAPDLIITDLQMPEMNGLELLEEIRKLDDQLPVIFMTAYGTVNTAVEAMKKGAFDYITKPFSGDELMLAVERGLKHATLVKENQILKAAGTPGGTKSTDEDRTMIGDGPTMQTLRQRLERIADSHGTVLIGGESGAGKEVAARWLHTHSPRANKPFLAINCAAIATNLLESELFGHEKGAFTGADKLRKGRFELADGGTLLLDEISEVSPAIQAKLLRVLQERAFERVGASATRQVDVRVIATTNRDLPAEVARGRFRQDLYFRLNVLPVYMPALRERQEDIPTLASHLLDKVASREGKPAKHMSAGALRLLRDYNWPGNVRELYNICERASVLTTGNEIDRELIAPWLSGTPALNGSPTLWAGRNNNKVESPVNQSDSDINPYETPGASSPNSEIIPGKPEVICNGSLTLDDIERRTIIATLKKNRGHRQRSADDLGIGVRTLGLKLKKWKEQSLIADSL